MAKPDNAVPPVETPQVKITVKPPHEPDEILDKTAKETHTSEPFTANALKIERVEEVSPEKVTIKKAKAPSIFEEEKHVRREVFNPEQSLEENFGKNRASSRTMLTTRNKTDSLEKPYVKNATEGYTAESSDSNN